MTYNCCAGSNCVAHEFRERTSLSVERQVSFHLQRDYVNRLTFAALVVIALRTSFASVPKARDSLSHTTYLCWMLDGTRCMYVCVAVCCSVLQRVKGTNSA